MGDFNSIRRSSKKHGEGLYEARRGDSRLSNQFIVEMELEEVPSMGENFSWFRPNGKSKA